MPRKTVEEKIALIDAKIQKKKAELEALESQKRRLEHPITPKILVEKAKEAGMSLEDIAEKLGIEV